MTIDPADRAIMVALSRRLTKLSGFCPDCAEQYFRDAADYLRNVLYK